MIKLRKGQTGGRSSYFVARGAGRDEDRCILMARTLLSASDMSATTRTMRTDAFLRETSGEVKHVRLEGEWARATSLEAYRVSVSREARRGRRKR